MKKETANTKIIHQECVPCNELGHWLRKYTKLENQKHEVVFFVGEIARSEFIEILKSSRRFEYRLSDLIHDVAILPFYVSQSRKGGYFNQNYGVVVDRSQEIVCSGVQKPV